MKKSLLLLLILTILLLTSCANGQPAVQPPSTESENTANGSNDTNQSDPVPAISDPDPDTENNDANSEESEPGVPSVFSFKVRDFVVEMDQDINDVLAALGEPLGIFEAPSCAFDGIDRIFSYPGVQIHTYPVGDSDYVHTIMFLDDSHRTAEGAIRLGSAIQSVFDAYGEDYSYDSGMYTFTRGLTTLEFFVENDMVMGITYGFIIE